MRIESTRREDQYKWWLPSEWLGDHDLEIGDEVPMREREDGVLEVYPPSMEPSD